MSTFPAWIARKDEDNRIRTTLEEAETSFLDDLDVTVQVHYSSINYKDALALHASPVSSDALRSSSASTWPEKLSPRGIRDGTRAIFSRSTARA